MKSNIHKLFLLLLSIVSLFFPNMTYSQEEGPTNKTVLIAILARNKAHVLPRFLDCIEKLNYNKKNIDIYINTNNNSDETETILRNWTKKHSDLYRSIEFESHELNGLSENNPHIWTKERFKALGSIRNKSMQKAVDRNVDFYFVVDCDNFITPQTLKVLVEKNKPIIAPMLTSIPNTKSFYSNFFCDISERGYFKSHPDYHKILSREIEGTFKVPVVHCTYLIQKEHLNKLSYIDDTNDYEFVIFSRGARKANIDQYICNEENFGTLVHIMSDVTTCTLEDEKKIVDDYFAKNP